MTNSCTHNEHHVRCTNIVGDIELQNTYEDTVFSHNSILYCIYNLYHGKVVLSRKRNPAHSKHLTLSDPCSLLLS